MNTGTTILITLLIIAVLILVHEWGHFITARKIGIPVWEFSIGFGPKIYGRKIFSATDTPGRICAYGRGGTG